ncbi:MAG: hypothetical protein RR263_04120 [Oscillospiraceae bacterium]
MDILLKNKDHAPDSRGYPKIISGRDEKIQRAIISLSVSKGAFPLDPQLGSLLTTLGQVGEGQLSDRAFGYIQQAVAPIGGVNVISARCKAVAEGVLQVKIEMEVDGELKEITLSTAV